MFSKFYYNPSPYPAPIPIKLHYSQTLMTAGAIAIWFYYPKITGKIEVIEHIAVEQPQLSNITVCRYLSVKIREDNAVTIVKGCVCRLLSGVSYRIYIV